MREDWIEVELGELLEIERGGSPRPIKEFITNEEDGINWIKIGDTKGTSKFINGSEQKIKPSGLKHSRMVYPNDFILSNSMSFGRPYIMNVKGAIHDGWLVLRDIHNVLNKDFLYYTLSSLNVYKQFNELATGSTVKNLNIGLVQKVKIILRPKSEQSAIANKIEALFSDLDSGITHLKKAQEQLKIYRQAVLKKAFEGGFTITNEEPIVNDELRITNERNQSNHTNQKNHSSDNLPKGWKWVKISDVCDMKAGSFVKANEINSEFENELFPCYGGNGLRGYVKSSTHEGLFPLVGRQGALCGNVHLVNGKFHATEHAVVVSVKKEIDIKCLYYKLVEMKLNQYSTGTAQPGLSVNKILPIEIIYPSSTQEQTQIVQEIESRLSVSDNLEFVIRNSIEKAEALRQSILKKAFEGKLLSQEEIEQCKQAADYEPASELLKKLQAEKLEKEQEKKKKPSVKKKSK
ncbi:MAG: restriction endonuclease subunit S [Weeksellaceae bacterium]|nr:restriction endonuclease subunit S [Weeksellaceae bacterium]